MIWGKTLKEKTETIYKQTQWFAWRPVKLDDGRWVWWQWLWCFSWSSQYNYDCRYELLSDDKVIRGV